MDLSLQENAMLEDQIQEPPARRTARTSRPTKRQRYTLVACESCKKRKIKCSGEMPCRQCAKHKGAVCAYDRLIPRIPTTSAIVQRPAGIISCVPNWNPVAQSNPLCPLSRVEAKDLLETLSQDVETLYPFIDLHEIRALVDIIFNDHLQPRNLEDNIQTARWNNLDGGRSLDLLKALLACALSTGRNRDDDPSEMFLSTVEKNQCERVQGVEIDIKDVAIATILSVYHYQRDNVNLAWRKIGAAARLCLELGLHRMRNPVLEDSTRVHFSWETKLFWSVYVLDRRYSFMANLPFTLQDRDIDFELMQADCSAPYLIPMVMFGRLGGKIIPTAPKFGSTYDELNENVREDLGSEIDRWIETTAIETSSAQSFGSIYQNLSLRRLRHFNLFFEVRGNQMRLSLYKHSLYTPNSLLKHQSMARRAVRFATDNIRVLSEIRESDSDIYESLRLHHYFFLASSLVSLHLAIRNSPQQFSNNLLDYSIGLKTLKSMSVNSIASPKLKKSVQVLENALKGLTLGPVHYWGNRLPPQLPYSMSPISVVDSPNGELTEASQRVDHSSRQSYQFTPSTRDASVMSLTATPMSSSSFELDNNVQILMNEEGGGRNVMQDFSVDDFGMSNFWDMSPETIWNDEAIAGGELSLEI